MLNKKPKYVIQEKPAACNILSQENMFTWSFGQSLLHMLLPSIFSSLPLSLFFHYFSPFPFLPFVSGHTVCFWALSPAGCPTEAWEPPQSPDTQSEGEKGCEKRRGERKRHRENRGWEVVEKKRRRRREQAERRAAKRAENRGERKCKEGGYWEKEAVRGGRGRDSRWFKR